MSDKQLFLPVKPKYADAILRDYKTLEVRKRVPREGLGERCLIYSSSPKCSVVGTCKIEYACMIDPERPTLAMLSQACLASHELRAYANGATILHGLRMTEPRFFLRPIPLEAMRAKWQIEPPQQWRYIDRKTFDEIVEAGR